MRFFGRDRELEMLDDIERQSHCYAHYSRETILDGWERLLAEAMR